MADQPSQPPQPGSPLAWTRKVLRSAWNDLLSVYYANTPIWRLLKSAALIFLGFFCWSGTNLLLSYQPGWGVLNYIMAYGFLVIIWGPLTHLVIVPTIIRLRRSASGGIARWFSRHGSKTNLTVFLLLVLILGTYPLGIMTFQFQVPVGGADGSNINPQLQCTKSDEVIHCHLTDSRGIDHVVISSGEDQLTTIDSPPFEFNLNESELSTVNGDRQFTVELRDDSDSIIRRYIRRADLIPG